MSQQSNAAVIVAAGSSSRMRGTDKLWIDLEGMPLLIRSIKAFHDLDIVQNIAIVMSPSLLSRAEQTVADYGLGKVSAICAGGATRQESVYLGLKAIGNADLVAIHDGARPLVSASTVMRGFELARERGCALCAVPVKNTIKQVTPDGSIAATPPRETLWEAQTPQVFRYDELMEAHKRARGLGLSCTDDAAVAEAAGHTVWVYEGTYQNIKVTTPEDLLIVRALLGGVL